MPRGAPFVNLGVGPNAAPREIPLEADVLTALARVFVEVIFASYRARAKRDEVEETQCGRPD
jgi:hypothetical protein